MTIVKAAPTGGLCPATSAAWRLDRRREKKIAGDVDPARRRLS